MIADLMPRYNEAHGDQTRYEILRSIVINGHEVAWVKWTYAARSYYELRCECYFTHGVGWRKDAFYGTMGVHGWDDCVYYQTARDLRKRELRMEYGNRFAANRKLNALSLVRYYDEIVADLIERSERGEFIGEVSRVYGIYTHTLAQILGVSDVYLVPRVEEMRRGGKITLVGSIICRPTKTAIASPSHS